MDSLNVVRSTARLSGFLFRNAFPIYAVLYNRYKIVSERCEVALIRRLVRPGDRVADVGANIGFYTQVLGECVGRDGHVYAFEPDETNFKRLGRRARPYQQIHLIHAAVAERSGNLDLYLSPDLNVDHRTYATDEARAKVTVDAIALDDFFRPPNDALHFIKMDIQGAEYAALLGMRQVVRRSPSLRILMEMWPRALDRFGKGTAAALLELVQGWGLVVRIVNIDGSLGETLKPDTLLAGRRDPDAYFSVLCARP